MNVEQMTPTQLKNLMVLDSCIRYVETKKSSVLVVNIDGLKMLIEHFYSEIGWWYKDGFLGDIWEFRLKLDPTQEDHFLVVGEEEKP